MKYGLTYPSNIPTREAVKRLKDVEKYGFDYVWIGDQTPMHRDPLVSMTALGLETERVKIGVEFDPYRRHPVLQAAALMSFSELTGGRAVMAIAAGGPEELAKIGYKIWERPLTMLRESVTVIRRLFDGETVDFDGQMVKVCGASLFSRSSRRIPIYMCARGEQTLRLAGEISDGVWSSSPFSRLKHEVNLIKQGARKAHRAMKELDIAESKPIFISNNRREALKIAKRHFPAFLVMASPSVLEPLGISESERDALLTAVARQDINKRMKCVTQSMLDAFTIYGTPDDCIEKLEYMIKSGATQVIFGIYGTAAQLEESLALIGTEIVGKL